MPFSSLLWPVASLRTIHCAFLILPCICFPPSIYRCFVLCVFFLLVSLLSFKDYSQMGSKQTVEVWHWNIVLKSKLSSPNHQRACPHCLWSPVFVTFLVMSSWWCFLSWCDVTLQERVGEVWQIKTGSLLGYFSQEPLPSSWWLFPKCVFSLHSFTGPSAALSHQFCKASFRRRPKVLRHLSCALPLSPC